MSEASQGKKSEKPLVWFSNRGGACKLCGEEHGKGHMIALEEGEPVCLDCADLDHLVYLPSGDATLTRRATKHSGLSAVVLKFSRARRRNERQGVLVEEQALDRAEMECAEDEEERAALREKAAQRRAELDQEFVKKFAEKIRAIYPACPEGREIEIAEHACEKHSGRVGRTASAKEFDENMIRLAVRAHIRHRETGYDSLLMMGRDRDFARRQVGNKLDRIEEQWQQKA
jgi:hypothetical protein